MASAVGLAGAGFGGCGAVNAGAGVGEGNSGNDGNAGNAVLAGGSAGGASLGAGRSTGGAAVSTGVARSCHRYAATAPIPAASVITAIARRPQREPDGATLCAPVVGFRCGPALRPSAATTFRLAMTASSPASSAPASSNRSAGFFAIARSSKPWNSRAAGILGRSFASDGTGCVRCAPR